MKFDKAYSSEVALVKKNEQFFVAKKISQEEQNNELYFFQAMRKIGAPSLVAQKQNEELLVEYLDDSRTLQDVESERNYFTFGALVKQMHSIRFKEPFRIDSSGNERKLVWPLFVEQQMKEGVQRQRERSGFDELFVKKIVEKISATVFEPEYYCLTHLDLHQNNVLLQGKKMFLIDKGSAAVSGDPLYDLAMISLVLPGFFCGSLKNSARDERFFKAFEDGYGRVFHEDPAFESYVLLRALERHPNPFEVDLPNVVKSIINV